MLDPTCNRVSRTDPRRSVGAFAIDESNACSRGAYPTYLPLGTQRINISTKLLSVITVPPHVNVREAGVEAL